MNKSNRDDIITKLATVRQSQERYKLGRNKLMEIAERECVVRRFGRAVRIDVQALDRAIEHY